MEFRANSLPAFGVKAVDDAAAELKRLQAAADEAQKAAVEGKAELERAEQSDREQRAAASRSGKKPKADAADKAQAKLAELERVAGDYEAVSQANHDLHTALVEHEDEIRRLAAEREAKARATMLQAVEALEHGRGEFAQARALAV